MSWQKYSVKLVLGFPLTLPLMASAVNIGDTYVQSQQNQPLNASINVSDIDPRTFSVKIAQADIYRQLGLSKDSDIQVHFEPTSSNGGQILLTTVLPINAPFTDVVLNITNKGETKTLPKTLLMPIDSSQKITTQTNTAALQSPNQQIIVSSNNPLNLPTTVYHDDNTISNLPVANLPTTQVTVTTVPVTTNSEFLNIQEVRTFRSTGQIDEISAVAAPSNGTQSQPTTEHFAQPKPKHTLSKNKSAITQTAPTPTTDETITYTLQRNDNLWTIASRLAAANHKDIDAVMADIMTANPNAFVNNDPTKLIANTQLQLPKYKVVPSQIGIKSATVARQSHRTQKYRQKTGTSRTEQRIKKVNPSHATMTQKPKKAYSSKMAKKSEMTIIAPNNSNGSAQGQSSTSKNTQLKGISPQVVAQVQQKRQTTATQANKVGQLNQDLVSAETRLKLQNAKLAQLEKRLKELNKK